MGLNKELSGVLVVSLEQAVAAPYCGLLLVDAGARVLKVERPEGDFARGYDAGAGGNSAIFAWLNRGKESVCLNLKQEQDMQILRNALGRADVFVSNLAPGAVARMGLAGDSLREHNPGLISCTITGYGESEAAAGKKAYDFLVQGESGVCSVTGSEEAPARVGVSLTDLSTGLTAFSAILRALIQRGRTGQGIDLSVSMFDVMADWMNMPLLAHRYMGGAPSRTGLMHSFVAPYGAFACGDGGQVLLSVQSNREFTALCESVLSQPELANDPRFRDNPDRYENRDVLNQLINHCFAKLDTASVSALLDDSKIANSRLNSVAELSNHPFLRNVGASTDNMAISLAALPVRTDGDTPQHVPTLDQHGKQIRAEFAQVHS
ncbi:MAG: CaiB/BaiF CoA transferase family protein [Granulosicoccus sp.]